MAFIKIVDWMSEWSGKAVSWLFLVLCITVAWDLFARRVTGRATDWAFDVNYMVYGTNFMIAGAYTLLHKGHVRVDVLYNSFSVKTRAWLEVLFYVAFMLPMCVFLLSSTWMDFLYSFEAREVSIQSAWHPAIWPYKFVMPLTFALMFLQSLAELLKNIYTLAGRDQYVAS
ncbi:MAG: TRAP transporter small permease subunit [Desulfarculaceae bacterium]|nr:TRAP transporter small permease subunit [Desulfarculaceae bacterium]MCF8071807.1 TRAP transporter small permease subunit [Desulfarculaceae bacterium]MCF8101357.1 TRAP transporter small permease subunit [Desulfarculaceae bacterium]MCF8117182.1 TRAP transporter small permease subunit [Desulfarculaceae bacterium]